MPSLKERIVEDMKSAMRAQEKQRLGAIRLILAAIKQKEVDERIPALDDPQVIVILEKMIKQRRDSQSQYEQAKRQDLADQEAFEIQVIQTYMPQPLNDTELGELIDAAVTESGASSPKEMGKVMGLLKAKIQGRADMQVVSTKVKQRLSG